MEACKDFCLHCFWFATTLCYNIGQLSMVVDRWYQIPLESIGSVSSVAKTLLLRKAYSFPEWRLLMHILFSLSLSCRRDHCHFVLIHFYTFMRSGVSELKICI